MSMNWYVLTLFCNILQIMMMINEVSTMTSNQNDLVVKNCLWCHWSFLTVIDCKLFEGTPFYLYYLISIGHVWHGINYKYKALKPDGTYVWKNEYQIQVLTGDVKKDALTTLSLLKSGFWMFAKSHPHVKYAHMKSDNGATYHRDGSDQKFFDPTLRLGTCTKLCHILYQTLLHLVPDPVIPCTRSCYTLSQTLSFLVPDPVTPCTRPCHTLHQTLLHLVPYSFTPCTKLCQVLGKVFCLFTYLPDPSLTCHSELLIRGLYSCKDSFGSMKLLSFSFSTAGEG